MKKLLSILVAICMIMQILPVFAEDATTEAADTYGFIINDTFDDGTVQDWVGGAGNEVILTPMELETGENVLKAEMPAGVIGGSDIWLNNSQQSSFTKAANVKFTGDNLIRIKARIKNTEADGDYTIKVNRPNATYQGLPLRTEQFDVYAVAGLQKGVPSYGQTIATSGGITNGYKNMGPINVKSDGNTFDYTGVDLTGKWIDYTVIINGATNEQWVTASFEHNGETITLVNGANSTFLQTDPAYSFAGRSEEKTFEAFERLTFVLDSTASAETLYIDSVSVENIEIVSAGGQNLTGKTIAPSESFRLQLLTDAEILEVPENVLSVANVTGTQTYNAEEKTIYFTPDYDLTEGTTYTLAVATDKLAAAGITYTGDTSFSIKAVGERFTSAGYVINDTFDDGTENNWVSGKGKAVTLTPEKLETGESVLKVELPPINGAAQWGANGEQSTITKLAGNGIPYAENNIVKISARIKNAAANDGYAIKANRPDSTDLPICDGPWSAYALTSYVGTPRYGLGISNSGVWVEAYKNWSAINLKSDGTTFDYTGVDLTDKWIDYTILINDLTGEYTVKASFEVNGQTVTVESPEAATAIQPTAAYTKEYGNGATKRTFNNFERLTIASTDSTDGATLYIDSISVENIVIQDAEFTYTGSEVVKAGDTLTFSVDTEAEALPEGFVKVNGEVAPFTYDAVNKVLTVTPANIVGGANTIVFDAAVLEDNGINVTGETTFSVPGVGYVFNDNFDDGTEQGWAAGKGGLATLTPITLETGEKVLQVDLGASADGGKWETLYESNIFKNVEGVSFTENNLIRIKARVKDASPFLIKVNRPDGQGYGSGLAKNAPNFNHHAVAGFNSGKPVYAGGVSAANANFKDIVTFTNKEDGTEFDYTDVDLTNTWIDYTVIINGVTNAQTVTASFEYNGETVTLVNGATSTFEQPATVYTSAGLEETAYSAFERLTFVSRDFSAASTLYLDSVSVENVIVEDVEFAYTGKGVVKNGDELTFAVTTDADTIPANIAKINGVAANATYDAENKVLTVIADNITAGNNTITFDTNVLSQYDLNLAGDSVITVTGAGFVINDNFDDGTAQNWTSGRGNEVILTPETLETGEAVLKAEMPVISTEPSWDANGLQSTIMKEANIKFTGENLIRIKARVKNAASNDSYMIKVNRPNKVSQSLPLSCSGTFSYMVAGFDKGQPGFGVGLSAANANYKSFEVFNNKADGTAFDYTNVDLTDKWIDYTILINGATNEQWVTAFFENNGEIVTLYSDSRSTFIQPADAYACAGRTGETTFAGFERLTFASKDSTDGATLYIDSVSVENIETLETKGQILANSVEKDGEIKVQLLADGEIPSVPAGAVTISNVETSSSYDAATKTITLTPDADLTEGTTYTVNVNKDVLVALGINYIGTTSFSVRCRGAYSTGIVLNDTFDTEGDIGTWRAGKTNGNTVTVEQTTFDNKGVLMFTADGTFNQNLHGKDGNIITPVGNGIEFKEGKKIIIETSVYKTGTSAAFDFKFNRPDVVSQVEKERVWATYGLFRMPGTKRVDYITGHLGGEGDTPYWSVQGTVEGTENLTTNGKWVTYKIVLDGTNRTYDMKVTIDGETYTMTGGAFSVPYNAMEAAFGKGTTKEGFDSLDTLTFKISHKDTIYVDYFRVYEEIETEAMAEFKVDNETVEGFKVGDTVKPTFTLTPVNCETTYAVISAIYIGGALEDVHINYVTTDTLTTYTETEGYTISAESASTTEIKAFVWAGEDALTTLKPVSRTAVLKPDASVADD